MNSASSRTTLRVSLILGKKRVVLYDLPGMEEHAGTEADSINNINNNVPLLLK